MTLEEVNLLQEICHSMDLPMETLTNLMQSELVDVSIFSETNWMKLVTSDWQVHRK